MASVPYRTNSYGFYLASICALIGVDQGDLQTTELNFLNIFFNRALRKIWEGQTWLDLCPPAEVRFLNNLVTWPNDYTQATFWTDTNVTVTPAFTNNPLDNRVTACSVLEKAVNATHVITSALVSYNPGIPYVISGFVKPAGDNFIQVLIGDGGASYGTFFNLTGNGSVQLAGQTNPGLLQTSIQRQANGWFYWSLSFTASAGAGSASFAISLSPDGTTLSYLGNTANGVYSWGVTLFAQQNNVPAATLIPFYQNGESAIDAVIEVYASDPGANSIGQRVSYSLNPNGIQLIGPVNQGFVYLYYRPQRPAFSGSVFNVAGTYTAGQSMYYTNTAGLLNYYTCLVATTAGQTPDTTPASWKVIAIPYVLFEYIVHNAYGDWLQTEGQTAKAQAMYDYAQSCIDDENDRQERQMGVIQPWRVNTHITSQQRGMGYSGNSFAPNGTFVLNS